MNRLPLRRRLLLAGAAVVAVVLGVVIFAAHDARHRILQALGPRTTVASITLHYPTVTLRDVHVAADPAPGAWPSDREFDAKEVAVDITAASLWAYRRGEHLQIDDVRVRDGTMVMLRTPGHLTMLPALRDSTRAEAAAPDAAPIALVLRHVRFDAMAVDLHDATLVGGHPQLLRFEQVRGSVGDLSLPGLAQPIALDLQGRLHGTAGDGAVSLSGSLTPAARDARLALRLSGVDMTALQPWLVRLGGRPVRRGTLDLALDASVAQGTVHAPGQLSFSGLAFGEGDDDAPFAGLERRAVLAALKRDGRVTLRFTLDGPTEDPKFTPAEPLAGRVAAGLGAAVGTGVKGVVEGTGHAIKGLLGGGRPDHSH